MICFLILHALLSYEKRELKLVFRMCPYGCLATGKDVGMIEVVRGAKTVMGIQKKQDVRAAMQLRNKEMHRWIKDKNRGDK